MQTVHITKYESIHIACCLSYCNGKTIALSENETIEAQISTEELQHVASFDVEIVDSKKGMFTLTLNAVLDVADYLVNVFFIDGNNRNASPLFRLSVTPSATIPSTLGTSQPIQPQQLTVVEHKSAVDNQAILIIATANKPHKIVLQMKDYILRDVAGNSSNTNDYVDSSASHYDYVASIDAVFNT